MSDLISRDALIRDISEKIDISKAERAAAIKRGRYDDAYFYSGEVCIARRIRRYVSMFAPTVDAEPVVHARWVHRCRRIAIELWEWCCSACGELPPGDQQLAYTLRYCPNCGAKMDKKEE